jgi:predicted nucleic acid-binding protein
VAFYVDTSAAVKLVVKERETAALRAWCERHDGQLVASDLTRTELLRATRRSAPDRVTQARAVLETLTLLSLPTDLFERAADLEPALLRTLDAVHLAAAMALGDDLEGIVTYDERFAGAAEAHGIPVVTPGT